MYITAHRHILTWDKQKPQTGPTRRDCFKTPKKRYNHQLS